MIYHRLMIDMVKCWLSNKCQQKETTLKEVRVAPSNESIINSQESLLAT